LGPNAPLHRSQDVPKLKAGVKEALDLAMDVQGSLNLSDEMRMNLEIVRKGILLDQKEPQPAEKTLKREKRPPLVIDDLYDLLDDGWDDEVDSED